MDADVTDTLTYNFLQGGGETGALIRAFDWSKTPLGSPYNWPQSLRGTVNMLLNARFPMFLWWGPELIQFYNDGYRPSLGNTGKHPAIGQRGEDCWQEIWPVIKPLIDHVLAGKGPTWSENQLIPIYRNNQMENVYWTFSYSPVQDEDGNIAGVLVVCMETTQQVLAHQAMEQKIQERTQELETANEVLQQANAGLEQLAYVASHDLQEPLRKVMTFTDMLRKSLGDNLSDKSQNYLDRITASSNRMLNLVKGVLNFSQLSKKGQPFEKVDLNTILDSVKDDFELLISEKEASITSTPLPVVEGLSLQLNQLFANLISNSLKFTATGTKPVIQITATLLPSKEVAEQYHFLSPHASYCRIEWKDNGIGFEQVYGERIFALFQRLHGKHEYSGTGIGLALCKKIVLNHHGHIYASSRPGEGAIFGVILPLEQPAEEK